MLFVVTKGRSDGKQSKHSLDGAIITIHRGLAIYKTHASDFWYARIRDPKTRRYVVRSTKETSRIGARRAAAELQRSLLGHVPRRPGSSPSATTPSPSSSKGTTTSPRAIATPTTREPPGSSSRTTTGAC